MNVPFLQDTTFTGLISTKNFQTSQEWAQAYSIVKANSATWEESSEILPVVTDYLSSNNVKLSSFMVNSIGVNINPSLNNAITVVGNISGSNVLVAFNQGIALNAFSFAVGSGKASGMYSHAEGLNTIASSVACHAEGGQTEASGAYSHAEGEFTIASGPVSHAEGEFTIASGDTSHAEGEYTVASGEHSHAEGKQTVASGPQSHAEGYETIASGSFSHAEGFSTEASQEACHAEGQGTKAIGFYSHAEGRLTEASGTASHAEGYYSVASGPVSHAEGEFTRAKGYSSHAAGNYAEAIHDRSWVWNGSTSTQFLSTTKNDQFMVNADGGAAFYGNIGINTDSNDNALTVVGTISTSNHGNSQNWNEASTLVQNNSGNFLPTQDNFSISSDILSGFIGTLFSGTLLRKEVPFKYFARTYYNEVIEFSNSGNAFGGGNLNLTVFLPFNNNFLTINNLNYLNGSINFSQLLTSFNIPQLRGITGDLNLNSTTLINTDFSELEYVCGNCNYGGGSSSSAGIEDLIRINLPKLQFVGSNLTIGGYGSTKAPRLSAIFLPQLVTVSGGLTIGSQAVGGNNRFYSNLTTINLSSLQTTTAIYLGNLPLITEFNLPSLKILRSGTTGFGSLTFTGCSALKDVVFNNLEYIGGYSAAASNAGSTSLTSIRMPNLIGYTGVGLAQFGSSSVSDRFLRNFEFGTNTLKFVNASTVSVMQVLNQQSVDNLLKAFAGLDGTNNTTLFGSGRILELHGNNQPPSYTSGVTTSALGSVFHRTGNNVIAYVSSHGHNTDDIVTFTGNGQAALNGTYTIRVSSANQFEYTTTTSSNLTGSSTVTMRRTTAPTDGFRYFQTIALRGTTITINMP